MVSTGHVAVRHQPVTMEEGVGFGYGDWPSQMSGAGLVAEMR